MAHLIIWGDPRSVLGGGPHAGAEEVRSLAGLEAALDGHGSALVLAASEQLAAEREALETWLRGGDSKRVVVVAVAEGGDGDGSDLLLRYPFLHDVVVRPVSPARLRLTLERAVEKMNSSAAMRQLQELYERRGSELDVLNKIGVQLSAERDIDKLLDLILQKSREITGADAGSLYLVEHAPDALERPDGLVEKPADQLRFKLAQNDTMALPFEERAMPLDKKSIAGYVAVTGEKQNVTDAYQLSEDSPFHISRSFDEVSGYRTKSMLVVPMRDHRDRVIGVVQLINKKRDRTAVLRPVTLVEDQVIPFTTIDEQLASSLASQAAVAYDNVQLLQRIKGLFETFVHAAVKAIERRDPVTSGHSERVAILTVGLMEKVDQASSGALAGERYTREQVEEVRYAALLHDFGKVAVQERYLRKGKKLYASQMIAMRQRFAYILRSIEADYLRERLAALESGDASAERLASIEAEYHRRRADAERVRDIVQKANEPTVVEAERVRELSSLPTRSFPMLDKDPDVEDQDPFPVEEWANGPWLSTKEVELLSITKGSLSENERRKIEEHVTETYKFLQKLPWTGDLERVPEIAYAHHEKLNGMGYPRQLKAAQIPRQSQMMTISDIYDALVALNRPYKKAVSEERAREILCEEAREGKVDQELLHVFLEAEIHRLPAFKELLQRT